jgi:hypothetical protein
MRAVNNISKQQPQQQQQLLQATPTRCIFICALSHALHPHLLHLSSASSSASFIRCKVPGCHNKYFHRTIWECEQVVCSLLPSSWAMFFFVLL